MTTAPPPPPRRRAGLRRAGLRRAGFLLAFVVAVGVGRATRLPGTQLPLVWPAAGVAVLWIGSSWGRRRVLAVDTGLLFAAALATYLLTGARPAYAVTLSLANLAMAFGAGVVLARLIPPGGSLQRPRDLLALGAAVATGAVGSAPVALLPLLGSSGLDWTAVGSYLLRISVSIFVVVAVGLRTAAPPGPPAPAGRFEQVLGTVAVLGVYAAVFLLPVGLPLAFLVLPVSTWIALRLTTTAAAAHVVLAAVVVLTCTLAGRGPFAEQGPVDQALLAQAFTAVFGFLTLMLALHRDGRLVLVERLRAAEADSAAQARLMQNIIDTIADGVIAVDATGTTTLRNPAAQRLTGLSSPDLPFATADTEPSGAGAGAADYGPFRPDGSRIAAADLPIARALAGETVGDTDLLVHNPATLQDRVLSASAVPLLAEDADGHRVPVGAVAAFRDVTRERRSAREVADARDLFAGVLDAATEQLIVGTDSAGLITVFNHGAERLTGHRTADILGRPLAELYAAGELADRAARAPGRPTPDAPAAGRSEPLLTLARTVRHDTGVWTCVTAGGAHKQVRQTVTAMRDGSGAVTGFIAVATDITARLAAEQELADSEQLFRLGFDTAPVGMAMVGLTGASAGAFLRVNPAIAEFVGRSAQSLLGRDVRLLGDAGDEQSCVEALGGLLAGTTTTVRDERRFRHAGGGELWGLLSASVVAPSGGGRPYLICLVEDVTQRRRAQEELRHQAMHDPLTGLPNRVLLRDRLELALGAGHRTGSAVGVLYLDLDGFKAVNDTAGHAAGDELLRQVAARLAATTRPGDTVARLGGDEFAVVCPDVARPADLYSVAARILDAVRVPFDLAGGRQHVAASVGMAVSAPGTLAEDLLTAADEAMYRAKRGGRDRIESAGGEPTRPDARAGRLVPQVRRALTEGELVLHGQPVVDLASGRIVAVETLVRWDHPERGLLSPADFLTAVETSPRMPDLGRWVLDEACRLAASWHETLGSDAPAVHVNVSGHQAGAGHLSADVARALDRHGLPADRLVLELNEASVPVADDALRGDLERLRDSGVRVAIDDLGTGYGGLVRLTDLPVDVVKIDVGLVAGLGRDRSCDAVVRAILGIGRSLGLSVIAEGVETPAQADLLAGYGCDTAQGYLFSPPRPAAALLDVLRAGIPTVGVGREA